MRRVEEKMYRQWVTSDSSFLPTWEQQAKNGYAFDPCYRRFTEFREGIDIIPPNDFFPYRSVSPLQAVSDVGQPTLHPYELQVLKTTAYPKTVEILDHYLARRYIGAHLRCVLHIVIGLDATELQVHANRYAITVIRHYVPSGSELGSQFNQLVMDAEADIVIISSGKQVVIDDLVPTYPIFAMDKFCMITPLQLNQVNGVDNHVTSFHQLQESLLTRVTEQLGAALHIGPDRLPSLDPDPLLFSNGISTFREGVFQDSRFQLVQPQICHHIPVFGHGWLSEDTRLLLSAAIEVYNPKSILELGTWYGLSSRYILEQARPDATLYMIDFFKSSAIIDYEMHRLSPSDKMFFNHLRLETVHANLAGCITRGKLVTTEPTFPFDRLRQINPRGKQTQQAVTIAADIYDGVKILVKKRVPVDMIFVDCEKSPSKLTQLLRQLRRTYPHAVIVGDDLAFGSVKQTITKLQKEMMIYSLEESYVILPDKRTHQINAAVAKYRKQWKLSTFHRRIEHLLKIGEIDMILQACQREGVNPFSVNLTTNRLIHGICQLYPERLRDDMELRERVFEGSLTWSAPVHNTLALTPFDYLRYSIRFH